MHLPAWTCVVRWSTWRKPRSSRRAGGRRSSLLPAGAAAATLASSLVPHSGGSLDWQVRLPDWQRFSAALVVAWGGGRWRLMQSGVRCSGAAAKLQTVIPQLPGLFVSPTADSRPPAQALAPTSVACSAGVLPGLCDVLLVLAPRPAPAQQAGQPPSGQPGRVGGQGRHGGGSHAGGHGQGCPQDRAAAAVHIYGAAWLAKLDECLTVETLAAHW